MAAEGALAQPQPNKIISLMGPTAAGKSALACRLAQRYPCHIISVDSGAIYRHMDIGTAKPSAEVRQAYPHALIDLIEPHQTYSVASFCRAAWAEIALAHSQGKIPLLGGGSMLYFAALERGLAPMPPADDAVRADLIETCNRLGVPAMHAQLVPIDPQAAERIHAHDRQRILRALEVWYTTGTTLSDHWRAQKTAHTWPGLKLCLSTDRPLLHNNIATRFKAMLAAGLVDEVRDLKARFANLQGDMPSMRCAGYRQVWAYLSGSGTQEMLLDQGIAATRQLCKRQLTWLRSMDAVHWFDANQQQEGAIFACVDAYLKDGLLK